MVLPATLTGSYLVSTQLERRRARLVEVQQEVSRCLKIDRLMETEQGLVDTHHSLNAVQLLVKISLHLSRMLSPWTSLKIPST